MECVSSRVCVEKQNRMNNNIKEDIERGEKVIHKGFWVSVGEQQPVGFMSLHPINVFN